MSSETIIEPLQNESKRSTKKRTWWARFDRYNGKILTLTPRKLSDFNPDTEMVAEVDNPICRDILRGKVKKTDYAVLWDYKTETWNLDVKSTTLVIKPRDNKLKPARDDLSPENSDMYLRIFKNDYAILVSVNLKNIAETMNLADIGFISTSGKNLLDLYLTRKNDPDYLIEVIPINTEQLINDTKILIKLPESITRVIDWENMSVYTKPVFKNYGIEYSVGHSNENISSSNTILKTATNSQKTADINIYVDNDQIHFESTLRENQMYYFDGRTKFNIMVCDTEIDRYVGGLELNTARLISNQKYSIPKPASWPDRPLLIYRNKYLRLNYTGEKNVYAEH